MKRFLLPSLCVLLMTGCDAVDRSLVAVAVDKADATADTNALTASIPVNPPTPPPNLPNPVQEVVRLAQTTLGESVLVDYIATIQEPFRLDAEQIIYLHDLGVPEAAIQALLKQQQTFPDTAKGPMLAAQPTNRAPITPFTPPATTENAIAAIPSADPAAPAPADGVTQVTIVQPVTEVSYSTFYDSLSPYGVWVDVAGVGRCWQPTVAVINPGWRPYCDDGYWVWSDCGWYWRSHYSWGWAPFHYGRWQLAAGRGWCWAPDNRWGPAWVTWRSSGDHCGWAPLPPGCGWSVGIGLTWGGRRAPVDCEFGLGFNNFVYLGWNRFCDPRPWRYCAPRSEVATIFHGSRPINDIHGGGRGGGNINIVGNNNTVIINNGPGLKPAQEHARAEIPKFHIVDSPDAAHTVPSRAPGRPVSGVAAVMPVYRPNLAAVAPSVRPGPAAPVPRREEPGVMPVAGGGSAGFSPRSGGSVTPGRPEPTIIRPGWGSPNANLAPSTRNNVVGSPYSSPGQSRPSVGSGFTASPVAPATTVSRAEAPKPAPSVIGGNRYPAQNIQPSPIVAGQGSAVATRPTPTYSAPASPAYRQPVYSAPATPTYQAEVNPAAPVLRSEPARVYSAPATPAYSVPSRPAYNPGNYTAPARGGGVPAGGNSSGGNNNNRNGQQVPNRHP